MLTGQLHLELAADDTAIMVHAMFEINELVAEGDAGENE